MKALLTFYTIRKTKINKVLQAGGAALVLIVNLFVFGSDFMAKNSSNIPAFEKCFLHFSEDHQVNKSPFAITLHFAMNPAPLMNTASGTAAVTFQTMTPIIFLLTLLLSILSFYSVILFGEKIRSAVFEPSLISPPPKRIL